MSKYSKSLVEAIRDFIMAIDDVEAAKIIEANPVLLTPKALKVMQNVIADFNQSVNVVDDMPNENAEAHSHWIEREEFLCALQDKKKNLHDTDVAAS